MNTNQKDIDHIIEQAQIDNLYTSDEFRFRFGKESMIEISTHITAGDIISTAASVAAAMAAIRALIKHGICPDKGGLEKSKNSAKSESKSENKPEEKTVAESGIDNFKGEN